MQGAARVAITYILPLNTLIQRLHRNNGIFNHINNLLIG